MPIPCQASFFIDTSNLQSARDIEDNVDSTQRDPARKLYYSRLFFFFLFFLSLLPWSRTTYTCLPISPFRSDHLSPFAYPFLDPTSRFFAPFFTPPFLSTRSQQENNRGEQSLNDACQKKSRFPPPLSLRCRSLLFPNFLSFLLLSSSRSLLSLPSPL